MLISSKLDGCEWGSLVECDRLDTLDDTELHTIGKLLADNQVVVIKGQADLPATELQRLCHTIGDLEGYSKKLKLYDDPNSDEAKKDWANRIESPTRRQRYLDYSAAPGVMRVTGKLKEDGSQTGFFGHDRELDWHCNKASNQDRHSYVTLYSVYGSKGSKTSWLNMADAYDDLPQEKKNYYAQMDVICGHKRGNYSDDPSFVDHINRDVTWPLVQNKYGRTGLFFPYHQVFEFKMNDGYIIRGVDFEREHKYLTDHILNEKYMYHHYWDEGDVVMSDQDITLHKRWQFDGMKDRLMWRLAHDVSNVGTPSAWGETTIGME